MAEYECYGAVTAHWVIFGSSGLQKNESTSQIFSFIHTAADDSTTVKSIVQPRKVKVFTGPHGADLLPGNFAVSPDHFPLEPCVYSAPFTVEEIQLNHYWWRAREDYEAKAALKAGNKRPHSQISFAEEQKKHCRKNFDIIKFYSELQNRPIGPYAPPKMPDNIGDMTAQASAMLEDARHAELEEYLCQAVMVFGDDPLIWMLRAVSARARGKLPRALHCIREASKLSGSSSIYYELARIYAAMGEKPKAERARQQADYKKQVEDSTCA